MTAAAQLTNPCRLCGARGPHTPRYGELMVVCSDCGFGWTGKPPTPAAELYDEGYFSGAGYPEYYDPPQRRFEAGIRLDWLQRQAHPRTLLEAGSAAGYFLLEAQRRGMAVAGVELSESASQYARTHLGLSVATGPFEEASFPDAFDAVCAWHVLEHVDDPRAFLDAAWVALRPGGYLLLEVPNAEAAAVQRLGKLWPSWDFQYHRWHFTTSTLTHLLAQSDFAVTAHDTAFSRLYWPRKQRWRNVRQLFIADLAASHSPRVTHPRLGDVLRVAARKPE